MAVTDPIVIIGCGQAGVSLARELRKANAEVSILLITADAGGFYSKPMLSNAFIKKLPLEKLMMQDKETLAEKTQISVLAHTHVTQIDAQTSTLHLEQNLDGKIELKKQAYSKLVIAVGATPFQPPIPGIELAVSINHLQDYHQFRNKLSSLNRQARIAIIGAGLVGCELANDLHFADHKVTLIERENQLLPRLISKSISQALESEMNALGVEVLKETQVQSIEFNDKGLIPYQIETSQGTLQADIVISALGLRPNLELAKKAGLQVNKGIVCSTSLQTSADNIFVLGDCAEVQGLVLPYILPIMEGAKALAQTLNGQETQVKYPCMPVAVKTSSFPIVVCPPLDAQNPELDIREEIVTEGEPAIRTLYYLNEQLVGFCLAGAATKERQKFAVQTLGYLEQLK